jgi:hypothetical protein
MNYTAEMDSSVIMHIKSFINIGLGIQKPIGGTYV